MFLVSFPFRPAYSRTFLVKRGKYSLPVFCLNVASVSHESRFRSCFEKIVGGIYILSNFHSSITL